MRHLTTVARVALPLLVVAAGAAAFVALGRPEEVPRRPPARQPPLVETVAAELHAGGLELAVSGLVVPHRELRLAAQVAGRVARTSEALRAGLRVEAGELLLEIDPRDYQLDVRRCEAEEAQARVDLRELELETASNAALVALATERVELERRELARARELVERETVSQSDLDRARRDELSAREALQRLASAGALLAPRRDRLLRALELALVRLERARLDLERTRVSAPVSGVVLAAPVEAGAYVTPGTELVRIEDTARVEVQCNLRMVELRWVLDALDEPDANGDGAHGADPYALPATPATVSFGDGRARRAWAGTLARYDGVGLDDATRTARCRVVVDEPAHPRSSAPGAPPLALVRGMFVDVMLHCRPRTPLLSLPAEALRPGNLVWRVRDGALRVVAVTPLPAAGPRVLVPALPGQLEPGERVAVTPLAAVDDGMVVRERGTP